MTSEDKLKWDVDRILDDFVDTHFFSYNSKFDTTNKSPALLRSKIIKLLEDNNYEKGYEDGYQTCEDEK